MQVVGNLHSSIQNSRCVRVVPPLLLQHTLPIKDLQVPGSFSALIQKREQKKHACLLHQQQQ